MKWLDDEEGQSMYGSSFHTYDYFVLEHAVATSDPRGDQAHLGSHFIVWHGLFLLEFEESLLAIDPSIGAMPYWDLTQGFDVLFGSGDTEMGSLRGTGTLSEVVDGAFPNWTVGTADDAFLDLHPGQVIVNGTFGTYDGNPVLRSFTGPTDSILRFPSCTDATPLDDYTWDSYDECVSQTHFTDFYWCTEQVPGSHGSIHFFVGSADSTDFGFYCPNFSMPNLAYATPGDYVDIVTTVNDPIFFFHHNFVTMQWHEFMLRNASGLASYWDYPAANATVEGTMLPDVVSDVWPFVGSKIFVSVTGAPTGALTYAEAICWLTPHAAPYTYDRIATSPTPAPTAARSADTEAVSGSRPFTVTVVLVISMALCL